jgi:peptidoglycan hydrolase-like protein with peptidoglycan-binding domain
MATRVRGPGVGQRQAPQLSKLENALLQSGIAKTPAEAKALAKKLLSAFKSLGLVLPQKAGPGAQLKEGLKQFQDSKGLPQTGELDAGTQSALVEAGILPPPPKGKQEDAELKLGDFGLAKPGDVFGPDTGTAKQSTAKLGLEGPAGRADPSAGPRAGVPTEKGHSIESRQLAERNVLTEATKAENLQSLMSDLAQAGFPGMGKGKAQLESAVAAFQAAHGLPETGIPDAVTLATLAQAGEARDGSAIDDDPEGRNDGEGNAPAGDDDSDDADRGHAQHKEGGHDEGFYEIPPLAEQIRAALDEIARDEKQSGPQTYSWDVTFFRPGTYGRRQPAEALWHLVVTEASPFDAVWDEAREKLEERLAVVEPDAEPPSEQDFTLALRRARFRD